MAEAALSELAVYSARPTVRIDGQEQFLVTEMLLARTLAGSAGGLWALELRLSTVASGPDCGAALAFDEGSAVRLGARVAVYTGDETAPREVFQGTITALEADFPRVGPPELVVL